MDTLAKALGHSSIRTTVDLYAHLATEDIAADLARVIAARDSRLQNQSEAQTRINKRVEATSGFETLSGAQALSGEDLSEAVELLHAPIARLGSHGSA